MVTPTCSFIYGTPAERQRQAVIDFWQSEGAMPPAEARRRAPYILATADREGQVIGVATAIPGIAPQLNQPMLSYRTYIGAEHRRQGIARTLLKFSFEQLAAGVTKLDEGPLGLIMEIPVKLAAQLDQHLRWPDTEFSFIGRTEAGNHLRVRYFELVTLRE